MSPEFVQYVLPVLLGSSLGVAASILTLMLNRIWKKKDDKQNAFDAIATHFTEVNEKIDALKMSFDEKIDSLRSRIDEHIEQNKVYEMKAMRLRIIKFNDEERYGFYHSGEHFTQVLADIHEYEQFCEENPWFPNDQANFAIANIRQAYQEYLKKDVS